MMKSEFDILVGKDTPLEEYKLIEFVYNWHPSNLSKEAAASLYKEFGITLFKDMESRAKRTESLCDRIRRTETLLRGLRKELKELE